MNVFITIGRRNFYATIIFVLIALFMFPIFVLADMVQNDVTMGGNATVTQGGSTTVNYRIVGTGGDGQNGCNASDGSPASITINTPAGITASPNPLIFTACGTNLPTVFTATTTGDFVITVTVSDAGVGTYNTSPATFTLHVLAPPDNTPPVITPNVSGTLGNNGWYVSNVNVSWSITDNESAISSSTGCGAVSVMSDTGGTTFTCSATSTGGTASQSVTVKRDVTAPTITASRSPLANGAGWNNSNVTVSYICSDGLSGIASCASSQTLSSDGAGQFASGTATDQAGNSASATVSGINIDKTAPIITASALPLANGAGWNNSNVTVSYTCSDSTSGIASCASSQTLSSEGTGQSASGTATDIAGNTATASVANINIDKTAPSITASALPLPNGAGWNNTDVTVSYTCSDTLSGIASCEAEQTLSGEGAGQSTSGTVTDRAGNTNSVTASGINIDKTAPSISASALPLANLAGWNNTDVTVTYTCSDALSLVASCEAVQTLSSEGVNQSTSGIAIDVAGNSATATVSGIKIDKTPPTISPNPSPAPNGAGWNNSDVTVSYECSDVLSDIASCEAEQTISTEGANQTRSGSATDVAGNTSMVTSPNINIDKTDPTITASVSPAPNDAGWNNTDVTVSYICSDALSDIASCEAEQTITTEGANQTRSGSATDVAGNTSMVTSPNINIDKTDPTITASVSPAPNGNGWNNTDVTVTYTCDDGSGSGIGSCTSPQILSSDGAGQSTSGTAIDLAGNSASETASNIDIDKTAPAVLVTGVTNGASYRLGSVPLAGCETTDTLSGIAISATVSVVGGNANGVGSFTATCAGASDNAGNSGSASVTYNVNYNFTGFFRPIDNLPTVNLVRAGSSIPIKFSLGGNYGLNILANTPNVRWVVCNTNADLDTVEEIATAGASGLSYDPASDQYNYVWKTPRTWTGCRQLVLTLNDGTQHFAMFQFR